MYNIPNLLSLIRLPLAFLFIPDYLASRSAVLLIALLSDGLDGYLARRYRQTTKIGALLDPFTDKFFVCFILTVLWQEGRINPWSCLALLSRDIAVLSYGIALLWQKRLKSYELRAIWCGKVTTCLQFVFLLAIVFQIPISPWVYGCFVVLGILAFFELYLTDSVRKHSRG